MVVVVLQDLPQELVLGMVDGFDDVFVISREIEEAAALARRAKFGKNILAGERDEIVGGV
jgi:hypothetical protein